MYRSCLSFGIKAVFRGNNNNSNCKIIVEVSVSLTVKNKCQSGWERGGSQRGEAK